MLLVCFCSLSFSVFGNWMRQYVFPKIPTQRLLRQLFLHILSPLPSIIITICKYWKYFGRIVFANMDLLIFPFKFRMKFCHLISLTHHFIIISQGINLCHNCSTMLNFARRWRPVTWGGVLLQSIIFFFSIFFLSIKNRQNNQPSWYS